MGGRVGFMCVPVLFVRMQFFDTHRPYYFSLQIHSPYFQNPFFVVIRPTLLA